MRTETYPCQQCGTDVTRPIARGQRPKWCPDCRKNIRTEKSCPQCGKAVAKRASYCSTRCLGLSRRRSTELVLYVGPPHVPEMTHTTSGHVFVSARCMVCATWFVSHNRRDRTCSTTCRDENHRDARRRADHRRRARKRNAYVADVNRRQVYERDGWRCHLCGKLVNRKAVAPHPRSATVDHIVPLAKGGTHEPLNCRTAHYLCNALKSDRGGGEQLLLIA